ncbi:MAG: hypothetical protein IPL88_15940 [Rhizobiales bacterium]|nr:hypothetical protein [Hyphomicrobiales bacterium]
MTLAETHSSLPGAAPRPGDCAARALVQADPRADDRRRRVEISREGVVIQRRVATVAMRLALPASAFRGVGLAVAERDGRIVYEIRLLHRDADLEAPLARLGDECEATAEWRLWARWFALPALVEREEGRFVDADAARGPAPRRRGRLLRERRTRFALRRKTGVAARMATTHSGEREIVCYE